MIIKLIKLILWAHITSHFDHNCLFVDQQHGFRKNHSCETTLNSILDLWKVSVSQKKVNIALFIDLKNGYWSWNLKFNLSISWHKWNCRIFENINLK